MTSSEKKQPVGFATHIIAGGIAGMSEAVSSFVALHLNARCGR